MATKQKDLKCLKGVYYETDTAGDKVNYRFTAEKILWIPVLGTDSGGYSTVTSATTPTVAEFSVADGSQFAADNRVVVGLDTGNESQEVQSVATNLVTLKVALSVAPAVGDEIRPATCKAYVQRVVDSKYAYSDSEGLTQYTITLATGLQYLSLYYDWTDYETGLSEALRCYMDGIDPATALNPCDVEIMTGLTNDQHLIVIERLTDVEAGATNYLRHDSFFLFNEDESYPRAWFKTGSATEVGTIMALPNIREGGEDLRNSYTVIGSRIAVEVPGTNTDRVINPKNPFTRYTFSKSVDVDSIYYPSAPNFVGRERKAIIIEKAINSAARADHISLRQLRKYRLPKPRAAFQAIGNPLIEMGDCISVEDQEKSTVQKTQKNWVEGMNTTAESMNYVTTFDTTPYKPEQSYFTAPDQDITQFGNYPIINVEITVGGRREQGAGTWADLGGGSYKLTDATKSWGADDWVNDGWGEAGGFDVYDADWQRFIATTNDTTTITCSRPDGESYTPTDGRYYVISTEGRYTDHPYDPYWSDESGKFVNIKFDLLVSAWVDLQIRSENGGILIAHLFNPDAETDHFEKLVPGNYVLQWDGVDWFGTWNQRCGIQETRKYTDKNIETTVGKGFFVAELLQGATSTRMEYSQFYVEVLVRALDNTIYEVRSRDLASRNPDYNELGNQWIYLKRGDSITGLLVIDPEFTQAGTKSLAPTAFWSDEDPDELGHTTGLKLTYQSTSPTKRLAQLELKIIPLCFSICFYEGVPYGCVVGRTWLNIDEVNHSDYSFKDYTSGRSEYFLPIKKNFIFDSAITYWKDKLHDSDPMIMETRVGWGFEFWFTLTDKSGRTDIDRKWITYRHRTYENAPYVYAEDYVSGVPICYTRQRGTKNTMDVAWVTTIYP